MQDQNNVLDIYDFYEPSIWDALWFKIILGVIGILGIGYILYLILKTRKKKISLWELTLQELNKFTPSEYLTKGQFKAFYFNLTRILKEYFYKRYNLKTLDKTDDEFIALLSTQKIDPLIIDYLTKIRDNALWVKFANYDIIKTQAEHDLVLACDIIERTKPRNHEITKAAI